MFPLMIPYQREETFVNCRDLRELYASHNTLTELPGSLHGLTALQVLDLSFNKLNILSPETLSSLSALLELKLVRNRIRELREGAFDGLPQLTLIDLENNDLRVIERNAIRALPELQAIRLGKNRLQVAEKKIYIYIFLKTIVIKIYRFIVIIKKNYIDNSKRSFHRVAITSKRGTSGKSDSRNCE